MKKFLSAVLASAIGVIIGIVALIVWSGFQLYEGAFGDDDAEWQAEVDRLFAGEYGDSDGN